MRRALAALLLVMSTLGFVSSPASAVPTRDLAVTGTEAEMYPAFDPSIDRYAVTTTSNTSGTLDVAATPGPGESVTINGGSSTHLTGLAAGDRITVAFTGGTSPHTYTVMYLPAGFPKLTVSGAAQGSYPDLEPGLVGLTLNTFNGGLQPAFDAIVDRNGVPAYAVPAAAADLDLKQQPSGEITVSRPTLAAGKTGASLAVLDPQADLNAKATRYDVLDPLTNTDGHDSVRLADGSTILIGYEPNSGTSKIDATIQKRNAAGTKVFEWTSADYAGETTAGSNADYAHINSVVSVEDGDIIASFRHLSSAYRIATVAHDGYNPGDVIWKFGGRHSTFAFVDDPFPSGPCAQHTVSELPNGHILVFDNGTSGFCVDPNDPTGATIARAQTRITEYALDLTATPKPTATLVWSYPTDASKYAFFAGSARRMSNGDTLIGWAADKNVLTTEVNQAQDNLWELTTPPTDGSNTGRYMTYRAELITALRPTITPTGTTDGATVLVGDTVPASAICADWRGDTLDTCTVTGLTNGVLDTSSVGSRTWTVASEDGAGNTTTVTFHYAVRKAIRQPDGVIRKAGSSTWKGGNLYGATGQTVHQRAHRRDTARAFWKVQNDGERADAFVLDGPAGTRRFKVHYFAGSTDVTSAVVAGTYRTSTLAPGSSVVLRVEVTPTRRAHVGSSRTFQLHAASAASSAATDVVATRVTVRS